MTDNTETAVSPDPRAIAQAVLLEVADEPEQVGQFVEAIELEDHVTDFRFQSDVRGYEGWQWSVTLFHDIELDSWTVNESSLVPTDSALMPPKWVPWKDRLEPTDLSPTDSIGTDPDDERIEPGEVEPSSLEDVNDAVQTFRLTRRHVLSPLGRAQAAKRWYEGPRGPKALSTKTAEGNLCSTCGFFVPLTGELDRMFGVCANKWSPDDGRVVSLDHGCGEHSEIEPPEPSHLWIQSKPAFDDLHVDIVAAPKKHRTDSDQEQSDDREETREEALAGVVADAVDLDDSTSTVVEGSGEETTDVTGAEAAVDSNGSSRTDDADDFITGDEDESDDDESDEATEQDILENTEPDDGDDLDEDESVEDADGVVSVDDTVAPGLEAVVDLIEQLRQARADAEAKRAIEEDADDGSDDSDESGDGLDESDDSDEDLDDSGNSDDFDDEDEPGDESVESDESNEGSDESDGDDANNGDASDEDETEGISDDSYDDLNGKSDGTPDDESDESADGSGDLDESGDGFDESDDSDEDLVDSDGFDDSGDGDESDGESGESNDDLGASDGVPDDESDKSDDEPVVGADIDDDSDDADTDSDVIDAVDEGNDGDVSESGDGVEDSDTGGDNVD